MVGYPANLLFVLLVFLSNQFKNFIYCCNVLSELCIAMADSRNISREFLSNFIKLYKSYPCLWEMKNKSYSDRNKKDRAYQELIKMYKEVDPSADRNTVVKKINSLRTVYKKEQTKVNASIKSGAQLDDVYKPRLWYFDMMEFLSDQDTARTSRSPLDLDEVVVGIMEESIEPVTENDNEIYELQSENSSPEHQLPSVPGPSQNLPRPSYSRPKKIKLNEEEQTTDAANQVGKRLESVRPGDPYDVFGKHVADRLRNMKQEQVKFVQKLISDVLFEGDMDSLNRHCKIVGVEEPPH